MIVRLPFVVFCLGISFFMPAELIADTVNTVLYHESVYLQHDPEYQLVWAENERELRNFRTSQTAWLPDVALTPSYTYSTTPMADADSTNHEVAARLSMSQNLPWGGSVSLDISPSLTMVIAPDESSSFSGTASAQLSVPVLAARSIASPLPGYSLLQGLALQRDVLDAEWNIKRFEALLQRLERYYQFVLLQERVLWEQKRMELTEARRDIQRQRYAAGTVSLLQLRDFEQDYNQQLHNQNERIKQLSVLRSQIPRVLAEQEIELDRWLEGLQQGLDILMEGPLSMYRLQQQRALSTNQLFSRIQEEISLSPDMAVSMNWTPPAANSDSIKAQDVLDNWWEESVDNAGWSVSVSLRIPLTPYRRVYTQNRRIDLESRIAELNQKIVVDSYARQHAVAGIIEQIDSQNIRQAERTYQLEEDRLELFRIRRDQGEIDDLEYRDQEIQVEIVRLQMLQVLGDRIFRVYRGTDV